MPVTPHAELAELAAEAAAVGGGAIRSVHAATAVESASYKSSPTDPISEADRRSAAAILGLLSDARPHDGVLCEEGGDKPSRTGFRWVVDPLDGTVNYLATVPHFAVSVACEQLTGAGWRAVVGVVHDVRRDETFTAVMGGGAHLDGTAIAVNEPIDLAAGLIATEFSYDALAREHQATVVARLLPRARDVRSTGSSALDLCWVAAGRYDGFYEDELYPWDWAAGGLIVREAGGVTSTLGSGIVAAGETLHRHLRDAVAPTKPGHASVPG